MDHPKSTIHLNDARHHLLASSERYDVIIDCNNPGAWSLAVSLLQNRSANMVRGIVRYNGSAAADPLPGTVPTNLSSGALLNYSQLASFDPNPISATPDRTYPVALSVQPGPGGGAWMSLSVSLFASRNVVWQKGEEGM